MCGVICEICDITYNVQDWQLTHEFCIIPSQQCKLEKQLLNLFHLSINQDILMLQRIEACFKLSQKNIFFLFRPTYQLKGNQNLQISHDVIFAINVQIFSHLYANFCADDVISYAILLLFLKSFSYFSLFNFLFFEGGVV